MGFELLGVDDSTAGGTVTVNIDNILIATDDTDQELPASDTPIQVTFGAPQSTAVVDLDALGAVTFLETDEFGVRVHFSFGRTGGGGVSTLWGRILLNGTQLGSSVATEIDDQDDVNVDVLFGVLEVEVNDIMTCEIYRDGGNASTGVYARASGLGWNPAPSMQMNIFRTVAVAT